MVYSGCLGKISRSISGQYMFAVSTLPRCGILSMASGVDTVLVAVKIMTHGIKTLSSEWGLLGQMHHFQFTCSSPWRRYTSLLFYKQISIWKSYFLLTKWLDLPGVDVSRVLASQERQLVSGIISPVMIHWCFTSVWEFSRPVAVVQITTFICMNQLVGQIMSILEKYHVKWFWSLIRGVIQ